MEVEVLEKNKNMLKFRIVGDKHTITNILREKVMEEGDVTLAGYDKTHPLSDDSIFVVKTSSKDASSVVKKAIDELSKEFKTLEKEMSKLK